MLWLAGADLRAPLLAIPPLIPLIHRDLPLDEKSVGTLTALPTLLFGAAALPGSFLISRVGVYRAVLVGILAIGIFSALRGVGPSLPVLFGGTFLTALAVALIQPGFPSLVREWFPERVGFATALYTNGLLIGESTAAAVTAPFVVSWVGGSWEIALAAWSLPIFISVVILLGVRAPARVTLSTSARQTRVWRDRNTIVLGLLLGFASASYWGSNGFIPDYLRATNRVQLIPAALALLNFSQFPSAFVVGALSGRLLTNHYGFIVAGFAAVAGFLLLAFAPGDWVLAGAALTGFASALVFVIGLALPPLLAAPHVVHHQVAAIYTLSYSMAFAVPVFEGALWDASRQAVTVFVPSLVGAVGVVVLANLVRMPRTTTPIAEVTPAAP